jgi:hypothetical protein
MDIFQILDENPGIDKIVFTSSSVVSGYTPDRRDGKTSGIVETVGSGRIKLNH